MLSATDTLRIHRYVLSTAKWLCGYSSALHHTSQQRQIATENLLSRQIALHVWVAAEEYGEQKRSALDLPAFEALPGETVLDLEAIAENHADVPGTVRKAYVRRLYEAVRAIHGISVPFKQMME